VLPWLISSYGVLIKHAPHSAQLLAGRSVQKVQAVQVVQNDHRIVRRLERLNGLNPTQSVNLVLFV
jgi:hypothetical protein